MNLTKVFLNCLFPKQCLVCESKGEFLCNRCFRSIPKKESNVCPICQKGETFLGKICEFCKKKKNPFFLDGLLVCSYYKHPVLKESIYALKYSFLKDISKKLSLILKAKLKDHPELISDFIFLAVPLHPKKRESRGFNQTELLLQELQKNSKKKFEVQIKNDLLKRVKDRKAQMSIKNTLSRTQNVSGCFQFNSNYRLKIPKKIVILDDVCTTGSTLNECAKVLKKQGVEVVWGVVLARQKSF